MKHTVTIFALAVSLTACVPRQTDPTLVPGVQRQGQGVYYASSLTGGFGSNPAMLAIRQCNLVGGQLNVLTSMMEVGITGTAHPVIIFKCGR